MILNLVEFICAGTTFLASVEQGDTSNRNNDNGNHTNCYGPIYLGFDCTAVQNVRRGAAFDESNDDDAQMNQSDKSPQNNQQKEPDLKSHIVHIFGTSFAEVAPIQTRSDSTINCDK